MITGATVQDRAAAARRMSLVLGLFGALSLVICFLVTRSALHLEHAGLRTTGTVTGMSRQVNNNNTTYHAVVEFEPLAGGRARFTDRTGSNPPSLDVGQTVPVLYLADAPGASAVVDRGPWNLIGPLVMGTIGIVLCALAWWIHGHPGRVVPTDPSAPPRALPGGAPAPRVATPAAPAGSAPTNAPVMGTDSWRLRGVIGLLGVVAIALFFGPPAHKTGDAGLGALLCILAILVVALGMAMNAVAAVLFAGAAAAVAVHGGAAAGLDPGAPAQQWAEQADRSEGLRRWWDRYATVRRALRLLAVGLLIWGIGLMLEARFHPPPAAQACCGNGGPPARP